MVSPSTDAIESWRYTTLWAGATLQERANMNGNPGEA
jgi:hypothetical protein